MICDPKEIAELLKYILKNDHFRNYIKELAKQVVIEMDESDFFDHTHNKDTGEIE